MKTIRFTSKDEQEKLFTAALKKNVNDYFVNNKSALQVSNKYNYTYDGVKKIFKRVNDKIKGL